MSIEAMKQMANYIDVLGGDSKKYRQAIAEAEKEEPVAWMQSDHEHISLWKDDYHTIPLYIHPPKRVSNNDTSQKHVDETLEKEHEPVCDRIHCRCAMKGEWVGLTDEEAQKAFAAHNCDISTHLAGILARAIKAKLKEKNT